MRFKSENKHVDTFDWHLSDGGSIPPASTKVLSYNSLQVLSTFSFVDLSIKELYRASPVPKITPIPATQIHFQDPWFLLFSLPIAKNIALRLNKKELPLGLKTRYISEVAKIVSELSQCFVYRYRQSYNKLLSYFFNFKCIFSPKNFLVVVYTQLYLRLFPKLFTCPN